MDGVPAGSAGILRLGRWSAAVGAGVAAIGVVLWFARFAFPGGIVGWLNDLMTLAQYTLGLPIAFALHAVLRRNSPTFSLLALIIGVVGMVAVVVLQLLLLVRAVTFAQQAVPVTIAILVVGVWLVATGYLERSIGVRNSLRMSVLAVPYFGYPIWAWWMARVLSRIESTGLPTREGHR